MSLLDTLQEMPRENLEIFICWCAENQVVPSIEALKRCEEEMCDYLQG